MRALLFNVDPIQLLLILYFLFYFAIYCPPNNSTWDKKTGPNAPLYDMEGGLPGFSVHSCVENWKAGGGLPDKMCVRNSMCY
jgi:hypothetical protein